MNLLQETILATVPAGDGCGRLLLVHRCAGGESRLEMRQQSWADGIGWFTQSSVQVEPGQLSELRTALGGAASRPRSTLPFASPVPPQDPRTPGFTPRIVRADSA